MQTKIIGLAVTKALKEECPHIYFSVDRSGIYHEVSMHLIVIGLPCYLIGSLDFLDELNIFEAEKTSAPRKSLDYADPRFMELLHATISELLVERSPRTWYGMQRLVGFRTPGRPNHYIDYLKTEYP